MIVAVLLALALGAALWAPWRSAPRRVALRLTPFSFEQGGQSDAVWSPTVKPWPSRLGRRVPTNIRSMCVTWIRRWRRDHSRHRECNSHTVDLGRRIVFRSTQAPAGLWSVSPVGGEPEPLQAIDNPIAAAVSRDGTALAWLHAGDDGAISIWISSPLGAAPTP